MPDVNEERFARIERKLSLILTICVVQAALLAVLCVGVVFNKLLSSTLPMLLFLIVVICFGFVFRKQIPGWFGGLSRYVFARMIGAEKVGSTKDGPIT